MAYATPFVRATLAGTLAEGNEIWSSGYAIINTGTTVTPEALLAQVAQAADTIHNAHRNLIGDADARVASGVKLEYTKFSLTGTDGKIIGDPVISALQQSGGVGRGYAPQVAMVSTFVADKFRDPGKYNRFYLPIVTELGDGEYRLQSNAQIGYNQAIVDTFDLINTLLSETTGDATLVLGVVSQTREGSQLPMVSVKTGQIYDTQQRRRNQLAENYLTTDLGL